MPLVNVALVESLPAATSRKKPITISWSASISPSISAWTRTLVRSSVGLARRASIISCARRKISGKSSARTFSRPPGARSSSPTPSVVFISVAHALSSSSGIPMKLPITRETTGWAMSSTTSQRLPALEPVEHLYRDRPDLVLVLGDPLRREAALEERLEPVVLGRVHRDEHRGHQLERDRVGERHAAAALGGVGLPVAAHGVDVLGGHDRPEARLVRVIVDLRPVDRALAPQALEDLVGRAVLPVLGIADVDLVEALVGLRGHLQVLSVRRLRCRRRILASQPVFV